MPEYMGGYVAVFAVLALLMWVLWLGRRRAATRMTEGAISQPTMDQRDRLQRAMERLQVNIMEFGRDIEGRLDTKIATLSTLISDADERISELRKLTRHANGHANGVPPLHTEVYHLADEGIGQIEIARRTSITPGEVALILGLREPRNA